MRIIRGSHRGRQIHPPKNLPVRPTTDLAKESLFNILENNYFFEDLKVLDLFAGTGSISFEFASRGSNLVLSVDSNVRCIKFISETSEKIGLDAIRAIRANAFIFLKHTNLKFDIIFADLGVSADGTTEIVGWSLPEERSGGRILEGEIPDQVKELVKLLREEAKVI